MTHVYNTTGDLPGKCNHPMRGNMTGRFCAMHAGHRGRHTSVAYPCDNCGKMRRGSPVAWHPDAGQFCFMCASWQMVDRHGIGYRP